MVQPHEGELHASNRDFDKDWQRRFLNCSVQVKIRVKNFCYWIFVFVSVAITFYSLTLCDKGSP